MRFKQGLATALALFASCFAVQADWTDGIAPVVPQPTAKPEQAQTEEPQPPRETPPSASRLKACPAVINGHVTAKYLPPVKTPELCGDEAPLEVSAVHGIKLQPAAQMNCRMTGAVADWALTLQSVAKERLNTDIKTIQTASSYVCRRRNNKPDGKFSEHATMNALDVSGFQFGDGNAVSVLDDWRTADDPSPRAVFLRQAQGKACEIFTTVLGPDGDEHHKSHFHVDLGCHGKTCTFKLCQ